MRHSSDTICEQNKKQTKKAIRSGQATARSSMAAIAAENEVLGETTVKHKTKKEGRRRRERRKQQTGAVVA